MGDLIQYLIVLLMWGVIGFMVGYVGGYSLGHALADKQVREIEE